MIVCHYDERVLILYCTKSYTYVYSVFIPEKWECTVLLYKSLKLPKFLLLFSVPFLTFCHSWSLLAHCSKAPGSFTFPAHTYQNKTPKAYTSTLQSYRPVKSSGAMCIGVPTMLPLIIASGLQKPRSVNLARFSLSSWNNIMEEIYKQFWIQRYGFLTVFKLKNNILNSALLVTNVPTNTFLSLMSRWTKPWLWRNRIPSTTSIATTILQEKNKINWIFYNQEQPHILFKFLENLKLILILTWALVIYFYHFLWKPS